MKIRKLFAAVSALCMMIAAVPAGSCLPALSAASVPEAYTDGTYQNLTYKRYADFVEISGYVEKVSGELIIPAEIDGLPVKSIGIGAFCVSAGLTSVVIPDNVTCIGSLAFAQCPALTSVTIPESVTTIGGSVFMETPWLKAMQEQNLFVTVNSILIDGTKCTGDITIPEGVTAVADSAFLNCSGLNSVIVSDGVTSIDTCAFFNCLDLQSVLLPESVAAIGESAFGGCPALTSVTIKNPDCEICDYKGTISSTAAICGYPDSTAQAYAEQYNHEFIVLDGEPDTIRRGDVNGDTEIDIRDVIMINQAIFGKVTLTAEQNKAADLNGDGMPDAEDSLNIMKYIVRLIDSLE